MLFILQNPLPMHHLRIPNLKEGFKIAPRDPSLKNNWRGRTGQRLTDLEITVVNCRFLYLYIFSLAAYSA